MLRSGYRVVTDVSGVGYPETSVTNYNSTLPNILEERRPHLHRAEARDHANKKKSEMLPPVSWLSQRRQGFIPRPVHVRFVVGTVTVGQVFLRVHRFTSDSAVPPMLLATDSAVNDTLLLLQVSLARPLQPNCLTTDHKTNGCPAHNSTGMSLFSMRQVALL